MIRYIKRFTGTKTEASYVTVLQFFNGTTWVDLDPRNATWETVEDEKKYNKAAEHEFRNCFC